jgi:hypothetical protein
MTIIINMRLKLLQFDITVSQIILNILKYVFEIIVTSRDKTDLYCIVSAYWYSHQLRPDIVRAFVIHYIGTIFNVHVMKDSVIISVLYMIIMRTS